MPLSHSLHEQARELAKQEGVSIHQLITTALAEKMSALMPVEYLEKRAARGDREEFEAVLAKIPDVQLQRAPLRVAPEQERRSADNSRSARRGVR